MPSLRPWGRDNPPAMNATLPYESVNDVLICAGRTLMGGVSTGSVYRHAAAYVTVLFDQLDAIQFWHPDERLASLGGLMMHGQEHLTGLYGYPMPGAPQEAHDVQTGIALGQHHIEQAYQALYPPR